MSDESSAPPEPLRWEDLDHDFVQEVAKTPGGEGIVRCYACGTCAASCPVSELTERYNPLRIIRMALLGMKEEVLKSDFVWLCASCYACQERCPQDVCIADLMTALRNLAIAHGYFHPGLKPQIDALAKSGRMYELDEFDMKKRAKANLPELELNIEATARFLEMAGLGKAGKTGDTDKT
jgi:heterodisulfide reductase subunit C